MIYLSFFRKKTTHIYIFIFILLFFILNILIIGKSYYNSLYNKSYEGSYLSVIGDTTTFNKLKKIKDIKNIRKAINYENEVFLAKSNISKNNILIPQKYKYEVELGSTITINYNNLDYNFTVLDYSDDTFFYINNSVFNVLSEKNDKFVYIFVTDKWYKYEKLAEKIYQKFNLEVNSNIQIKNNNSYDDIIVIINSIIILNIFLFLIMLFITIVNVLEDEKKKNYLYHALGFSKKKIKRTNLFKILLLFLISFFPTFLTFVLYFMIKVMF